MNRKNYDSIKGTIDAAAMQSDLAKRFSLPGAITRKVIHVPSGRGSRVTQAGNAVVRSSNRSSPSTITCACCESINLENSRICGTCGYYLHSVNQSSDWTLAESRGLVRAAPKVKVMIESEWKAVESSLADRNDAYCPICMEGFKEGREVLLSCSHMFHPLCLSSFEKFMKVDERSCPVCRGLNYQKKITRLGSRAFEVICSVKIQRMFRGYTARKEYYLNVRAYYQKGKGGTSQHKTKFYVKELSMYMSRIDEDLLERKKESDNVMSSIDRTLQESRELDLEFSNMLRQRSDAYSAESKSDDGGYRVYNENNSESKQNMTISSKRKEMSIEQWDDALLKAEQREKGFGQCAICMCENSPPIYPTACIGSSSRTIFQRQRQGGHVEGQEEGRGQRMGSMRGSHRPLVLLSCSHVFHKQCVLHFEDFLVDSDRRACPVCRGCDYSKRNL